MTKRAVQQTPEIVSILVRAKLSRREWIETRQLALELGISSADLVGRAIRDLLARQGRPTEGSVRV